MVLRSLSEVGYQIPLLTTETLMPPDWFSKTNILFKHVITFFLRLKQLLSGRFDDGEYHEQIKKGTHACVPFSLNRLEKLFQRTQQLFIQRYVVVVLLLFGQFH